MTDETDDLANFEPDEELGGTFAMDKERLGLDPDRTLEEQLPEGAAGE